MRVSFDNYLERYVSLTWLKSSENGILEMCYISSAVSALLIYYSVPVAICPNKTCF